MLKYLARASIRKRGLVFHTIAVAHAVSASPTLHTLWATGTGRPRRTSDRRRPERLDDVGRAGEDDADQKPDADEVPEAVECEAEEIHEHGKQHSPGILVVNFRKPNYDGG